MACTKLWLTGNWNCSLQKERVSVGDVIYIEANSGAVKRVGRCDAYATEFDLEAEEYVPLPKVCFLSCGALQWAWALLTLMASEP